MSGRFPGKHTALVTDNEDPMALGRVRVQVPDLLGEVDTGWCLPSSPFAGEGAGFAAVPPVGSLVHVEWPAGDVTRVPVWSGGAWGSDGGVEGAGPDKVLLVTPAGHRIVLADTEGSEAVEIEAASGAKMELTSDGVTVEFGSQKIEVTRSSISLNGGALEVR